MPLAYIDSYPQLSHKFHTSTGISLCCWAVEHLAGGCCHEPNKSFRALFPKGKRLVVAWYDHIRNCDNLVHAGHRQGAIVVHCRRNLFLEVA